MVPTLAPTPSVMVTTVPAASADADELVHDTKASPPLPLPAALADPLERNPLSVNLIFVPTGISTHATKAKLSGVFEFMAKMVKSVMFRLVMKLDSVL